MHSFPLNIIYLDVVFIFIYYYFISCVYVCWNQCIIIDFIPTAYTTVLLSWFLACNSIHQRDKIAHPVQLKPRCVTNRANNYPPTWHEALKRHNMVFTEAGILSLPFPGIFQGTKNTFIFCIRNLFSSRVWPIVIMPQLWHMDLNESLVVIVIYQMSWWLWLDDYP